MALLSLLVLLSCILATLVPLTVTQTCSNNFTGNSTYGLNRDLILSSLPYNVTANRGFYTANATLQDSETIYALALCRGDLLTQSCSDCVNSSSHYIMTNCPNQVDVLDYGASSHCIVRSSNTTFFTSMVDQPARVVYRQSDIIEFIDEFDKALNDLVDELIIRAAEGNSTLKLATGEKNYTQYKYENIVYGLMQCIPGLSPVDCTSCLRRAVAVYKTQFLRKRGVNVISPSCIFQYDLVPFLESTIGGAPPPPPVTFAPPAFAPPPPPPDFIITTVAQNCSNNFTGNSTYGMNRDLILSSFPNDVTANRGFYTATATLQDSETIYTLALCRGDLLIQSCSDCVNSSRQYIMTNCPNQVDVLDYGASSQCIVRSSNKSFFTSMVDQPAQIGYIQSDIIEYIDEFDKALRDLIDELIIRAAEGNSTLKLATGEKNYTQYENIVYGLMQCIPSLSRFDCTNCLRGAVTRLVYHTPLARKKGVNVISPSCIFQFQLAPFLESAIGGAPPPPPPGNGDNTSRTIIISVVSAIAFVIGLIVCIYIFLRKRKQKNNPKQNVEVFEDGDQISIIQSLQYDFETISMATDNFSNSNKLGQGGFGAVYKGRLLNGREIAVKRLAKESLQGDIEFKNEVMLVAKLQHRNLVRLLGFCCERTERLLIYEFMPKSSLDHFIFNPSRRELLGWDRRYKIIVGVSRGLQYLHEDSRLVIIHCDLKASNILLDEDMNPKIADFGMARLFVVDEIQGNTSRIVGTYGYMAPEYAMHGQFSVKSDVFSFGVVVLEILSGQKNNSFHNGENVEDLISYAWKTWREGTASNLIDPVLRENSGSMRETIRCIHIGLLCVQENVAERPTMASVAIMLSSSSLSLPVPSKPAFFLHSGSTNSELPLLQEHNSGIALSDQSNNEVSITELYPR